MSIVVVRLLIGQTPIGINSCGGRNVDGIGAHSRHCRPTHTSVRRSIRITAGLPTHSNNILVINNNILVFAHVYPHYYGLAYTRACSPAHGHVCGKSTCMSMRMSLDNSDNIFVINNNIVVLGKTY